jgi:HlyD family secretion protein
VLTAEQSRLERIEQDIESCRILAPRDGVVLRAVPSGRRAGGSPLEAGATVRERQLLMEMPDLERLRARILVHESQVARIQVGQEVSLRLDSFPSRNLGGEVVEISRTPEPRSWLNPEVVEYAVLVGITAPPEAKIGMTVVAEIDAQAVESD